MLGNEDFFLKWRWIFHKRTENWQFGTDLEGESNECSGKSRVVIIRSKNDRKIFSNPKQCLNILKNSVFGNVVFKDVEVRGNGRSVKLEVRKDDVTGLNLSNITKLGSVNSVDVSVRLPLLDSYFVGVIGSFDKDLDIGKDVFPHLKVLNN